MKPENNRQQVFKAGSGTGKSGSFFFMTHDKRFMIKTMTKAELDIMIDILPSYIQHHQKYPSSLIAKIFGVFTVQIQGLSKIHFALMENTALLTNPEMLRYKFDLKGSTFGRNAKGIVTSNTDRKDLDFLKLIENEDKKSFLQIRDQNRHLIMQMRRDVNYLQSRGLIDYSLLVAYELSQEKISTEKIDMQRSKTLKLLSIGKQKIGRENAKSSRPNLFDNKLVSQAQLMKR